METEDMNRFVEGKVKEAMQANNAELLHSIGDMISKISAPSSSSSLNPSVLDAPKFKRKSNEEQYQQNHKVMSCLKEAEDNLDKHNVDAAKQSIIEGVSFGLIGVVVALLLICIILAIMLFRLRRRLKKASDTLYPNGAEHSYTPLKRPGKNAPVVELKHISTMGEEEEIDSPTFSTPPPPPTFPPPRSVSQSSFDKPPELPTRRPKQAVKKSTEKGAKLRQKRTKPLDKELIVKSIVKDEADGIENGAFSEAEEKISVKIPDHEVHVDLGEDDCTYESYDHSFYRNMKETDVPTAEQEEDGVLENVTAYEVPDNQNKDIEKDEFSKRQSSSSGLPEFVYNDNETNPNLNTVIRAEVPLQPFQDDIYDNDDEVEIKDTGLPSELEASNLDDLQTYEDIEADDTKAKHSKVDGVSDAVPTSDSALQLDEQVLGDTCKDRMCVDFESQPGVMYDSMEIGSKIDNDSDSEIGLYEDLESEHDITKSENGFANESDLPQNEIETTSVHKTRMGESNVEVEKEEQLQELDQCEPEISTENQNQEVNLPKVPPRRDLLSRLPSSPNSVNDPLEGFPVDQSGTNNAAIADSEKLEEKPVKQVGDVSSIPMQHSYFLDMDDSSEELNEQHQKRISVHKMVDSEMPLKQLLGLYDKRDNSLDKSSNESTIGEDENADGLTMRINDSANEQLDKHAPASNGFLANGGLVESMDEFHDDDDNLYDVPPVIQTK